MLKETILIQIFGNRNKTFYNYSSRQKTKKKKNILMIDTVSF